MAGETIRVVVLIVSASLIRAQLPFPDPTCSWVSNLTDVQDLPQHRYMILEDCLYYNLSQEADSTVGKGNALVLLPPTKEIGDKIQFNIHKVTVRQVWLNELWKDMTINGYIQVSWNDYRLKWNSQKWKLDTLTIKSYGHLWVPDINSERYQTATQSSDFTMYHNLQAKNNGTVSATFEYRMQAVCDTDFENYPQDVNSCCFNLKSYLFEKLMEFKVWQRDGRVDPDLAQTNWDLRDITADTLIKDTGSTKTQSLRVCLKAARQSSTLKIELTVPMVVSAVLVLIAPLFGTMQSQVYVKLFALLLQFLCFQFLVTRTPLAGLGDATPKLYRFYEFTLAMTLASLIITLVAGAISHMERSMPPSHRLVLMATAFNNHLCCGGVRWEYPNGSSGGDNPNQQAGKPAVDYRRDWREIFIAVNNICSIVLMISYVIGVITLTA
jgi:hypothetical protein